MAKITVYQGQTTPDEFPTTNMTVTFEFTVNEFENLGIQGMDSKFIQKACEPNAKGSDILHALSIIALYYEFRHGMIPYGGKTSNYDLLVSTGAISTDIQNRIPFTVPPKTEGYYWAKAKTGKIMIVEKTWGSGLDVMGSNLSANTSDFVQYIGPIEKPEF